MHTLSVKQRLSLAFETIAIAAGLGGIVAIGLLGRGWPWLPQLPIFGASWLLIVYMLGIVAWLRFRGEPLSDYGLFAPESWPRVVGVALGVLVLMYAYMWLVNPYVMKGLSPWIGSGVNLTRFGGVSGNVMLYFEILPMVWLSAGFTEEILFRGFLFNRLLMILGRGPLPFAVAAVIQAALFSLGHVYQGWPGVVQIAFISLFLLWASRALKGNLWPAIIMHGLLDSISLGILAFDGHFKP